MLTKLPRIRVGRLLFIMVSILAGTTAVGAGAEAKAKPVIHPCSFVALKEAQKIDPTVTDMKEASIDLSYGVTHMCRSVSKQKSPPTWAFTLRTKTNETALSHDLETGRPVKGLNAEARVSCFDEWEFCQVDALTTKYLVVVGTPGKSEETAIVFARTILRRLG
jgi:hypothetical protein